MRYIVGLLENNQRASTRNVDKVVILELARNEPALRQQYFTQREQEPSTPYDTNRDPRGLYKPPVETFKWAKEHPINLPPIRSSKHLANTVTQLINELKNYFENQTGWCLLWNDDGIPKAESSFQSTAMMFLATNCRSNNIDVSAEANIGRGGLQKLPQRELASLYCEGCVASASCVARA